MFECEARILIISLYVLITSKNITRSYCENHSKNSTLEHKLDCNETRTPTLEHRYVSSPTVDACGTCGGPWQMLRCVKCCVPSILQCCGYLSASDLPISPHRTVWVPRDIHVKSRRTPHTTRMILMPWPHSLRFSLRSRSSLSRTRWQVVRTWSDPTTHSNT